MNQQSPHYVWKVSKWVAPFFVFDDEGWVVAAVLGGALVVGALVVRPVVEETATGTWVFSTKK